MKLALGQAYNGLHKIFKQKLMPLGVDSFYFNIDSPNWKKVETKKPNAYIWLADNKEERYSEVHNKIHFIEHVFKKPIFPDMNMYFTEGNKVLQYQVLSYLKVPMPKTFITSSKKEALKYISKAKYPFVLKDPYGYGGIHVFKITNKKMARQFVNKIFSSGLKTGHSLCKDIFYAQEYISTDKDLRIITVGNKIAAAYWRSNPNNWKHNLQQGGQVSFDNIPALALKLCRSISKKMKFHWMGYDLLIHKKNVKMIEYSATVRVKGAEIGGYDIRDTQTKYIIDYLKKYE